MIYDRLENFSDYAALAPAVWEKIAAFLRSLSPETPPGRREIDGEKVFAVVNDTASHEAFPDKLEYHRRYADVQLVASGEEKVLCGALDGPESTPYSEEKDLGFHRLGTVDLEAALRPGLFLLLFPGEGHLPDVGDGSRVLKVVVKIAKECFSSAKG
ncbi:MAG: YhcH/YjgK/YiaL family protein [Victivallaceae bacterium]|nr:YhcH/YjgK/YiaL family protein [Victivallaceae bacterium]